MIRGSSECRYAESMVDFSEAAPLFPGSIAQHTRRGWSHVVPLDTAVKMAYNSPAGAGPNPGFPDLLGLVFFTLRLQCSIPDRAGQRIWLRLFGQSDASQDPTQATLAVTKKVRSPHCGTTTHGTSCMLFACIRF